MKKVLTHPIFLLMLLCAMFIGGVLWGRHSTTSVLKLKINEETDRPYAEEIEQTESDDYIIADRININTASAEVFSILPGIGDGLAQRIVDYRTEHGPFQAIEDLCNVPGIGDKKFEAIRKYITVSER